MKWEVTFLSTQQTTKERKLELLIEQQEGLLNDLKQEISQIDSEQIIAENEELKIKITAVVGKNQELELENNQLSKSLEATRSALFTKMTNEKLSVFMRTQKQIDRLYYRESNLVDSRLNSYKASCTKNIALMRDKINSLADSEYNEISLKLEALERELQNKQAEIENKRREEQDRLDSANGAWRSKLENEELTEVEKKVAVKQKNIETFIGLNILSKAGIVLFLIGVIALGRFAYVHLPDAFKAVMIYALGAVLIGVGELFHKKEKTVFSSALISGGVAVLYAGVATSYFALDLFSVKIAFLLCIAVTAVAIALSAQVKSQVVCAFGAVGGYLPLVAAYMIGFGSAAADRTFLPVSSAYFCLLAIIIFVMTYNKKWYAAQYIGYGFQMLAIVGVSRCAWVLSSRITGYSYALPLAIAFAVISFVIYMMMPASKIITKKEISVSDCVLLALNTVSGAISVSVNMYNYISSKKAVGFTFLVFTVIYALLSARMNMGKRQKSDTSTATLVVLMTGALVFSMFVVPMVFGIEYIGIAWVVEGVLIAIISMNIKSVITELVGFATMVLSLGFWFEADERLSLVSFTVILIAFWVYAVTGIKNQSRRVSKSGLNIFYNILVMVMGVMTIAYVYYALEYILSLPSIIYRAPMTTASIVIASALLVSIAVNLGSLKNTATIIYSTVIRFGAFLWTVIYINCYVEYNDIFNHFGLLVYLRGIEIINIVLLIAINISVILLLASSTNKMLNTFDLPVWIYTAVISLASLIVITTVLMGQFDVSFSNVLISAIYIAFACVLLFIGFRKRYTVVRAGGLVLVLCALAKLCFVDTHSLDTIWKIGAYFAFGAVLIVISYFYQRFNKKLEEEAVSIITSEEKED